MKKTTGLLLSLLLILLCAVALADVDLNSTNFKDEYFLNFVKKYDTNNSGSLSQAELDAVTNMDVFNLSLIDLKGIEFFTNLQALRCDMNQLSSLDLSKNTKLETLDCRANQLKTLTLGNNSNLKEIDATHNDFEKLDLSGCPSLQKVDISSDIQLKTLTLGTHNSLAELLCHGTYLKKIDIGGCAKLLSLLQTTSPQEWEEQGYKYTAWSTDSSSFYVPAIATIYNGSTVLHSATLVYKSIGKVELTVKVPAAGTTPEDNPVKNVLSIPADVDYFINWDKDTFWFDSTGNYPPPYNNYTFEAGKSYYMAVMIFAKDNCEFADPPEIVINNANLFDYDLHNYAANGLNGILMNVKVTIAGGSTPGTGGEDPGAQGTDPGAQGTDPGAQGTEPAPQGETVQDKACTYQIVGSKAIVTAPKNRNAKSVTIPDTIKVNGKKIKVTQIADGAFMNMAKLKTVKIGNNVTVIGEDAFSGCKKLDSVTFGNSVKTIKANAFRLCKKLKKLFFTGKKLKKVAAKAFSGAYSSPAVQCPKGKAKAYTKLLQKGGIKKGKYTEK